MTVKKQIDLDAPLTDEQKSMLDISAASPIEFDEDNPELTDIELSEFKRVADMRRTSRRKQTVSIRLSPAALSKAKSLGQGYTAVLSRILEAALKDNEIIKKYL